MKEAAAASPFPTGKGTEGGFFSLVEEMRGRARIWGWEEAWTGNLNLGPQPAVPGVPQPLFLLL